MVNELSLLTSTGLIPTSITTAPDFIQFPLTKLATPAAEITISACLVISSGFFVCECTMLTVAFSSCHQYHFTNTNIKYIIKE